MIQLTTTYDDIQHCTASMEARGKSVAMDCPYTGKGEELSPGNLFEAAIAGCMLMSMGAAAMRDGIELKDAKIEVELVGTPPPKIGYSAINITVKMPSGIRPVDRPKLERAAEACLIKHSINPGIEVTVAYEYPDQPH